MKYLPVVLLLGALVLWAQRSPLAQVFDHVPAKDRAKVNPMVNVPNAAAAGRKLFDDHCSMCHGSGGAGGKRGPALISMEMQEATPGQIFWVITNGMVRKGMPSWAKLPEPQRWQIVTYLTGAN